MLHIGSGKTGGVDAVTFTAWAGIVAGEPG